MAIPRSEHPRPQRMRENWQNLNGEWQFAFDEARSGKARGLYKEGVPLDGTITVPFCPESTLSGIGHTDFISGVWYKRTVTLSPHDGRTLLHFGAVDYGCEVFVNGVSVGTHEGGFSSFEFDITDAVREGNNEIAVFAWDDTRDTMIPSGKQSAEFHSWGCFYTRTTGIWQTVWLEFVPKSYITDVAFVPHIATRSVTMQADVCGKADLHIAVTYGGKPMGEATVDHATGHVECTVPLAEEHLWEIGNGRLYDVTLTFGDDTLVSYFGLREVGFDGMRFMLNGKSVFMRLVLDQGFYPDGIYTAPTDEALKKDIELSLALGFNGARLHEKVFEERYLYHADRVGYIVWGEYPDWGLDYIRPAHACCLLPEWLEVIKRDRSHPSIIGWCPHNETWDRDGKKQDNDSIALIYRVTKAVDPTRPCIDTSGNYHVQTDVFCLHDYDQDPAVFKEHYDRFSVDGFPHDRFADRQTYRGEPVFISEYGGIAWNTQDNGWGYGDGPKTEEEFYERYRGLTDALLDNPFMCGLCYTQLTDVEQEQNGLYTYHREPKFDAARLKAIMSRKAAIE